MTTSRVALVTGGNKGIGKAICAGLAELGYVVYLGARDAERGKQAAAEFGAEFGGDVRFVQLDVTEPSDIAGAVARVGREIGHLDALVNNAGINSGGYAPPSRESADAMRRVYETNVFAVVAVTNAFLPLLEQAPAARIVNVTSKRGSIGEAGAWVGQPSMSYSTSKTALNAVTVHYARALASTPIKVNGAAPGHVATDFNGFRGTRTPAQGAAVAVRLATLSPEGPTGLVFEDDTPLAW